VLDKLIDDSLLEGVLGEIKTKISFTEKETDIYRIYQSGDLANLDGLDDASLKQLPNLLKLRNALYSAPFRTYLSYIAGTGPLSGKKTDMAINIYKPGGHLLCHDDVIGSRRISYILYLTKKWNPKWGGALRLYPTEIRLNRKGHQVHVPGPDFVHSIPPQWNRMNFFAVQPGESYHDVEEVYARGSRADDDGTDDEERTRIAISGWFHIPQQGEEGFKQGAEEKEAKKSSLAQLKANDTEFDYPESFPVPFPCYPFSAPQLIPTNSKRYKEMKASGWKMGNHDGGKTPLQPDSRWDGLTEDELSYLLQFMNPRLLTPETLREVNDEFGDASSITIESFLRPEFEKGLKAAIIQEPETLGDKALTLQRDSLWSAAAPPHKRRYLYITSTEADPNKQSVLTYSPKQDSPIKLLIGKFLQSMEFRKWLGFATGLIPKTYDLKARRFRRGLDYELATAYEGDEPRLELTLGLSPRGTWEAELPEDEDAEDAKLPEPVNNGGEECYLAPQDGDDGATVASSDDESDEGSASDSSDTSVDVAASSKPKALQTKNAKAKSSKKADPAIYKAGEDDEDDVLFHMAAGWNRLSIVLRDQGTMKFVRFVNTAAGADRWDITGDYNIDWPKSDEFEVDFDKFGGDVEEVDEEDAEAADKASASVST
jgi:Rps23 Pro-64 3,4-dihydroxylase Tpa1-like proline 4-hydroxylase